MNKIVEDKIETLIQEAINPNLAALGVGGLGAIAGHLYAGGIEDSINNEQAAMIGDSNAIDAKPEITQDEADQWNSRVESIQSRINNYNNSTAYAPRAGGMGGAALGGLGAMGINALRKKDK